MIQRTYEQALKAVGNKERVIIATDSDEVMNHCKQFDAITCLTSESCLTGTDRVAEVSRVVEADKYINLQGDEPIFPVNSLKNFIQEVSESEGKVFTAISEITSPEDYKSISIPKMVFSQSNRLLYSSRASIPANKSNRFNFGYKHVCIYAYDKKNLDLYSKRNSKTRFEEEEDLEINRFLELDIEVRCIEVKESGKAVDTQYDLDKVREIIGNQLD